MKIFSEIGYGNNTICNTELEKGKYEHRIPKFILPREIKGIYFRFWFLKTVYGISTNRGFIVTNKGTNKLKILFGIEGII